MGGVAPEGHGDSRVRTAAVPDAGRYIVDSFFPVEVSAEALRAVMLAGAGRGQVGLWDPRKPCQIGPGATPNPWRGLLTPRHVSAWWVGMGARPSKGMWPRASCVVGSGAAQGSLRTHHRFISLIRSFKEIYF